MTPPARTKHWVSWVLNQEAERIGAFCLPDGLLWGQASRGQGARCSVSWQGKLATRPALPMSQAAGSAASGAWGPHGQALGASARPLLQAVPHQAEPGPARSEECARDQPGFRNWTVVLSFWHVVACGLQTLHAIDFLSDLMNQAPLSYLPLASGYEYHRPQHTLTGPCWCTTAHRAGLCWVSSPLDWGGSRREPFPSCLPPTPPRPIPFGTS